MIRKAFKYIEEIWLGSDGKPSIKRLLALLFSVVTLFLVVRTIWVYLNLVKAVVAGKVTEPAQVITAAVNGIAQIGIIIGSLLVFIGGLLSLTGYLNLKQQELNPTTAVTQPDHVEANTSAKPQID